MKMKSILFLSLLVAFSTFGQEKFVKDGKWGISETGDKEEGIIVRADYDEIQELFAAGEMFFTGLRNDEWYPLTSNKIVNQQRYESIEVYDIADDFVVCLRDGYIDIISARESDFLIRGIQATALIEYDFSKAPNALVATSNEKLIGAINIDTKKEIFKAKYETIKVTDVDPQDVPYLSYVDGKNTAHDSSGKAKFIIPVEAEIMTFEKFEDNEECYIMINEKGEQGLYDSKNKWLIPMEYKFVTGLEDGKADIIVVDGKKGQGLYFEGKMLAEAVYIEIILSDKRGYLAILTDKKGNLFYLNPEGKITPKPKE